MAKRLLASTDVIEAFVWQHTRENPVAARLRAHTATLPRAGMQVGPDQAALLGFLVTTLAARRVLEIGTFTGYSALAMAMALPADGQLVTCDRDVEMTDIARGFWRDARVDGRIELRLGEALETLQAMRDAPGEPFDFAFIDADKTSYDAYYEHCLALLRPGGLIALDNMLWHGRVADAAHDDADTVALRALNHKIRDDVRVDSVLLTVGDGMTLVRRR